MLLDRQKKGHWQIETRRLVLDWEYDTPIDDARGWVAEGSRPEAVPRSRRRTGLHTLTASQSRAPL
jgi:hypothetical protein